MIISTENVKWKWIDFFFLRSEKLKMFAIQNMKLRFCDREWKRTEKKENGRFIVENVPLIANGKLSAALNELRFIVQWRKVEGKKYLGTMDCNWSCVAIVRPEFRIRSMRNDKRMVSKIFSCICCNLLASRKSVAVVVVVVCCTANLPSFGLMNKYFNGVSISLALQMH